MDLPVTCEAACAQHVIHRRFTRNKAEAWRPLTHKRNNGHDGAKKRVLVTSSRHDGRSAISASTLRKPAGWWSAHRRSSVDVGVNETASGHEWVVGGSRPSLNASKRGIVCPLARSPHFRATWTERSRAGKHAATSSPQPVEILCERLAFAFSWNGWRCITTRSGTKL